MRADLFGFLFWESNDNKVAAGGELGSEWKLRVESASPNAHYLIGKVIDSHPRHFHIALKPTLNATKTGTPMTSKYHGRNPADTTSPPNETPEMPADLASAAIPQELDDRHRPQQLAGTSPVYPRVHFQGRHGLACAGHSEFERYNINWDQVKQIAWDAFGVCPKVVTVFGHDGRVLYRGTL